MIDISRACFDAILGAMKPGVTFGQLFEIYEIPSSIMARASICGIIR